jgi:hypothetical protein
MRPLARDGGAAGAVLFDFALFDIVNIQILDAVPDPACGRDRLLSGAAPRSIVPTFS